MAAVVQISAPKNRIYIGLEGYFGEDEAKVAADQSIAGLKKMRPGFDVVSDISGFKPASPQAAEQIVRVQRAMKELGMGRLVRVVGGNALAKMQIQRTGTQAGVVGADYVGTREEADRILDQAR